MLLSLLIYYFYYYYSFALFAGQDRRTEETGLQLELIRERCDCVVDTPSSRSEVHAFRSECIVNKYQAKPINELIIVHEVTLTTTSSFNNNFPFW